MAYFFLRLSVSSFRFVKRAWSETFREQLIIHFAVDFFTRLSVRCFSCEARFFQLGNGLILARMFGLMEAVSYLHSTIPVYLKRFCSLLLGDIKECE